MSIVEPGPMRSESLVNRVKGISMSPAAEWDKIDTEPATIAGLYTGYVGILVGLAVIATLIGSVVFGYSVVFATFRPDPISAIVSAVISFVLQLVSVFIVALVIDNLAPSFDGQKNQLQAFKVAAYSGTAGWVSGMLGIFPPLLPLALLGSLYGLYILYLGLPKLMKAPQDKALGYTVVTIVIVIVVSLVIGLVTSALRPRPNFGGISHLGSNAGTVSGTLNLPGGSVDLGKLNAAAQAAKAQAEQMQAATNGQTVNSAVKAVSPDVLKNLLPAALPSGYSRTDVTSEGGAVGGMSSSKATGEYAKGGGHITLEVSDLAAAGAFAGLAGALNVESTKQTANGYEKIGKIDGRLTTEEYDSQGKSGKFSVIVANRFVVEANGSGVGMDDLKAAVSSVGFGQLEGLAKS